jgi:hypothetical protein
MIAYLCEVYTRPNFYTFMKNAHSYIFIAIDTDCQYMIGDSKIKAFLGKKCGLLKKKMQSFLKKLI